MAGTENETHSGDLLVLQPLPPTYFVSEKACSRQKQQEQPDLQTCLNNSFQLFAVTLMSKFENLTGIIVEKSSSRIKAKRKILRKGRQYDDERASFELSPDSESKLEKIKIRLIPPKMSFVMKLQNSYGCGVHHKICGYQLHTPLEHKILRRTVFLETSMRLLSRN